MNQEELIRLHQQFTADAAEADGYRRGHYEHLLHSLGRLIEAGGPTAEWREWVTPATSEFAPPVALGH
jgi:hypothetical protein